MFKKSVRLPLSLVREHRAIVYRPKSSSWHRRRTLPPFQFLIDGILKQKVEMDLGTMLREVRLQIVIRNFKEVRLCIRNFQHKQQHHSTDLHADLMQLFAKKFKFRKIASCQTVILRSRSMAGRKGAEVLPYISYKACATPKACPKGIVFVGRFGLKPSIDLNHFNFGVKVEK